MAHLSSTANEALLYGGVALGVILVLIGCGNLFLPEGTYKDLFAVFCCCGKKSRVTDGGAEPGVELN